jgi:hypothetical protein
MAVVVPYWDEETALICTGANHGEVVIQMSVCADT